MDNSETDVTKRLIKFMGDLIAISEIDTPHCKFCQSLDIVRNGHRKGVQYWICKNCGKGFVYNKALPKMRYPVDVVAKGVYDYYAGVSLNKIRDGVDAQYHLQPADSAVYGWTKMLTEKALDEAKKHPLKVGDRWVADETVVTLSGRKYWHLDIIDADTRFLLATKLSRSRNMADIETLLSKAREQAGRSPKFIVSDGWVAYPDAIERTFGSETKHVQGSPFEQNELNTNLIERWHGTLKDRLKPMRGMDKASVTQLVLDGFVLNYNYFRPHESLSEKTPAEVAGVKFPYRSWFDVAKSLQPEPEPLPKKHGKRVAYRVRNKAKKRGVNPKASLGEVRQRLQTHTTPLSSKCTFWSVMLLRAAKGTQGDN